MKYRSHKRTPFEELDPGKFYLEERFGNFGWRRDNGEREQHSMIDFTEQFLDNGLQVIIHEDHQQPLVCLNVLYKVGSRNENPEKTGFAHLFEHLMFGGSQHVPDFDEPLQRVGGENNAFTSNDITNYYLTVPSNNVETAFWLESDRMLSLSFDPEVLEVQRKVVIEEYKQRYLNQPYGDLWLKLRPEAYHRHPYRWPTIGKNIEHIERATMADVKAFFRAYYHPGNAILVIAGDIKKDEAMVLTEKWFGSIPPQQSTWQEIPVEPPQQEARFVELKADVPAATITRVYHMVERGHEKYHCQDLLSDALGRGKSSFLYGRLVMEKQLFAGISSYVMGSYDPGLLVISGRVSSGIDVQMADQEIERVITEVQARALDAKTLEKIKNQSEASLAFSEVEVLNRAMNLAYAAFLGDTNRVNTEIEMIRKVTTEDIQIAAGEVLSPKNCTTLHYLQV